MFRKSLTVAALMAGTAFLPHAANAAPAYVVETTEMHAGPDFDYPTVRVIHDGREVFINGCLDDWSWCDVSFHEDRGWVAGDDLAADYNGGRGGIISVGPLLGIGFLAFSFDDYWNRYYRGRPFYAQRSHWQSYSFEHHHDNGGARSGRSGERPADQQRQQFQRNQERPAVQEHQQFQRNQERPAAQEHQQFQRQAPETHANAPFPSRAEHQDNRAAAPERQHAAPAAVEHQQAAPPAHEQRAAAPQPQQRAAAPQAQHEQHAHGDDKDKKDQH